MHSYQQYLSARSELTEIDFPNVNPSFSTPFPASIGVRLGRANYSWTAQQLALTLTATIHMLYTKRDFILPVYLFDHSL